jgi:pumilio family protein 6
MPKLAVHGVGARVLESLFLNLPAKQTAPLKQEFYGPHFSLFVKDLSGVPTLKSNIETATTETQKKSAIDFVQAILNKGMAKSFYGYTYFQQLFAEYVDVVDPSEIRMISSTIADHSIHLLSTRVGTRVVAACASYGTPKDRKRICKSLKGYTTSSLQHRDAYLALLRLIQVTDDTVSIQKSVLNEILTKPTKENDAESTTNNAILDVALSDTGSKLFLMLLVKDEETRLKYFDPYERSILEPISTIKENGSEVPTSKKDPETRRNELLKHIKDPLIEACTENVRELLNSLPGARVLKEVYASAPSEKLAEAIVDVCVASLDDATNTNAGKKKDAKEDEIQYSIFEGPVGHRSIKNLILCDEESTKPFVSKLLVDRLGKRLPEIVGSNRGAFVAAALCKVPSVTDAVKKTFNSKKKDIEAKSKSKGSTAGYAALLKEMSN